MIHRLPANNKLYFNNKFIYIYIYIYNELKISSTIKVLKGKLEQCRFVELDYLVEDIYCYSEFHAHHQAMPKITDTKDDIQNLKIQNNAHWRDVQKCDWLSEYVL